MTIPDHERCYRAVQARDGRFDGWFVTAVLTTGIYCRPSCPTPVLPKRRNVRFLATAAAAQRAGFRACKRCRPDASPGSPEWDRRGDLVARAMRLIADGAVDREGVGGLARRLHVSGRHLHRLLVADVGAGPIALARAQRAQTARVLIETTDLPFSGVAFAAGFSSVRQFNDTVRAVFAASPTDLRRGTRPAPGALGRLVLRLPYRAPFDAAGLLGFLGERAVAGIEHWDGTTYRRSVALAGGPAVVELTPADGYVSCRLRLSAPADLAAAVQRCRRLLDLDADPEAIDGALGSDPVLRPMVRRSPGRRLPGHLDGAELAIRAVLGQQVSVAAARTHAARLVAALGAPLGPLASHDLTHTFPDPAAVAEAGPDALALPRTRRRAVAALACALRDGDLALDAGADRDEAVARLLALPGIGPWTASYVAMRALRDPDAFLPTDLGVRAAMGALGRPDDARAVNALAEAWRPWRSYATQHLWASLGPEGARA